MPEAGGAGPTPEFAGELAEEVRQRINQFLDPVLKQTVERNLIGHINEEIRQRLGRTPRKVALKLQLIRKTWDSRGRP
jgi:hypothetical protein